MALITCPNPNCRRENISDGGKCPGCGCTPATYTRDAAQANFQNAILRGTCPECNGHLNAEECGGFIGAGQGHRLKAQRKLECPSCGWGPKYVERKFSATCTCGENLSLVKRNTASGMEFNCPKKKCDNGYDKGGIIDIDTEAIFNGSQKCGGYREPGSVKYGDMSIR